MQKKLRYNVADRQVEREFNYIPVRYILAFALTLLEVLAIVGIVAALCRYVPCFYIAAWLTEVACVVQIAASDDNPDYKVPWLLVVLLVPVAGFMLYFLFYSRTLKKKYVRRMQEIKAGTFERDDGGLFGQLRRERPAACSQARMLCGISESYLYANVRQTYFPLGEKMWVRLLEDLRSAEKFIYMEYFIIEEGAFWNSILEILREKAAAGVEVRLLYDDIGCMATLPGNYARILKKCGIQAAPFSRMRGNADSEFNNRSHRKITVIDGRIGYTGGVNLADEYVNAVARFGHWKDSALRLEGEAVWELTRLFLINFGLNFRKMPEIRADSFPSCAEIHAEGYMVPFGDGPRPIYARRVAKSAIENMLNGAVRYAYMTTPYLIIDNGLCQCIENAALRGVDVRIVVPHIPDKRLVLEMTRSYYRRLMDADVKIYEYAPGFIHAKSYIADDEYAIIGTVNPDYRSLVHHFENGVWMYRCESIREMKADIEATIEKSMRITEENLRHSLPRRILRSLVRILAPLL